MVAAELRPMAVQLRPRVEYVRYRRRVPVVPETVDIHMLSAMSQMVAPFGLVSARVSFVGQMIVFRRLSAEPPNNREFCNAARFSSVRATIGISC